MGEGISRAAPDIRTLMQAQAKRRIDAKCTYRQQMSSVVDIPSQRYRV